ncbi:MAG: prephenate dehydrogenase [Treponema sp.]|jgi:prephenate dehydrogenase|nr:prephenate dehydrogenase [Treponema sp.]
MKPIEECTIGIAGMGLMGGAIALALRNRCGVMRNNLLACDIDRNALTLAEEAGIAQGWTGGAGEMLARCDVVFLCLGPAALLQFLDEWEHSFKPGALVTDIAGVKESIAARAEKLRPDIEFIPGHPMAGAEGGGFAAAARCNFQGKNYILTPLTRNRPENLLFLKDLIQRMGFGRITETSPADHDRKIAFTSQLCHVIAASLIDCEADINIARFGGGSFEDFTRIAMLNAPMWAELFTVNRKTLLERINQFENSLGEIKALIRDGKTAEMEQRLTRVRERRTALDELNNI